jgi:predicted transcriptional regulator
LGGGLLKGAIVMSCGIYCIENLLNNKKYIGESENISGRIVAHKSLLRRNKHDNPYLQRAYNKSGLENFSFYILEECSVDKEILDNLETYYIDLYHTRNKRFGYNIAPGGQRPPSAKGRKASPQTIEKRSGKNHHLYGKHPSEETLKKMSESHKNPSEEIRNRMRERMTGENNPMWGKHYSEEIRKRMGDGQRGEKNHMYGKHHSEEVRKKISDAHKNPSDETRKRMSLAFSGENNPRYGKSLSDEEKNFLREANLGEKSAKFGTKSPTASSHYFGISKLLVNGKIYWQARISRKYIGCFKTELDAARAYDKYIFENNLPNPLNFPEEYAQNNALDKN